MAGSAQSVRAVVLDMDGLMLDTEVLARAAWQQAAAALGCELSDAQYFQLLGRRDEECEDQMRSWFGQNFPIDEFRRRWLEHWGDLTATRIPAKAGLLDLLDWMDQRQLPFAVATSTRGDLAAASLAKGGVAHRIRCIVSGDEVSASKPAPDIFLEAARRLGVDPSGCIAVEDSDAGIQAAHAAGMRAVMVPDLKPPSPASATLAWRICATLHGVRDLLVSELG
jgi:beta-phosphoglucomutase-like phosphatase (HAD superfamily)